MSDSPLPFSGPTVVRDFGKMQEMVVNICQKTSRNRQLIRVVSCPNERMIQWVHGWADGSTDLLHYNVLQRHKHRPGRGALFAQMKREFRQDDSHRSYRSAYDALRKFHQKCRNLPSIAIIRPCANG